MADESPSSHYLFEVTIEDPRAWQSVGIELANAATILTNHLKAEHLKGQGDDSLLRAIYLFYGFAVENMIKGVLVGLELGATNEGKLTDRLTRHNLNDLFQWASMSVTLEERRVLEAMQYTVEIAKCPMPKRAAQLKGNVWYRLDDIECITSLLARLSERIAAFPELSPGMVRTFNKLFLEEE